MSTEKQKEIRSDDFIYAFQHSDYSDVSELVFSWWEK